MAKVRDNQRRDFLRSCSRIKAIHLMALCGQRQMAPDPTKVELPYLQAVAVPPSHESAVSSSKRYIRVHIGLVAREICDGQYDETLSLPPPPQGRKSCRTVKRSSACTTGD